MKFIFEDQSLYSSLKSLFISYFKDQWNILDLLGCSLFFIGYILKLISTYSDNEYSKKLFTISRYLFKNYLL
jgi:hypothetical protein